MNFVPGLLSLLLPLSVTGVDYAGKGSRRKSYFFVDSPLRGGGSGKGLSLKDFFLIRSFSVDL